jgi:hypothetical protein
MSEIVTKVEGNLRDRINSVPVLVTKPIDTIMNSAKLLISLKPVKAATNLIEHAGDGAVSFINTQADITRRWV